MAVTGYLSTANDTFQIGGRGSATGAKLKAVVVGTVAASAVVTVYNGTTTSDPVVATLDAATAAKNYDFHGANFPDGCFVKLTGGNAKVTVVGD